MNYFSLKFHMQETIFILQRNSSNQEYLEDIVFFFIEVKLKIIYLKSTVW